MTVYYDVFFVINLCMDLLLFIVIAKIMRLSIAFKSVFASALLTSGVSILLCTFSGSELFAFFIHLAAVLLACYICFGKTTLLRAIAACVASPQYGRHTVIVDTRGELNVDLGNPAYSLDVMSGYPRDVGIEIAVRTLGAQVIICDEIGSMADAHATLGASNCGVPIIASAHAASLDELMERPSISVVHRAHVFEKYVKLSRKIAGGFDYEIANWRTIPTAKES